MNRLTLVLIFVLLLSVGFNLALWYGDSVTDDIAKEISALESASDQNNANESFSDVTINARTELDVEPLRRLLQNGEYIELGRRLQDALRVLPNNIELLLMEAEFIAKTEPLSDAILNYYDLLERPIDEQSKVLITSRIEHLTHHAVERFQHTQQWDLLAQFVEPLFQRQPQDKHYTLSLAEAYGKQRNYSLMESVLASLDEQDPQADKVRKSAYQGRESQRGSKRYTLQRSNTGEPTSRSDESVSLVRNGDQYLVDLYVEQTPVRMLIDTGASMTALSARTYDRLSDSYNSEFLGVFQVNTAGGQIEAPMVTFPNVTLGKYTFKNLTIVIIPSDPFDQAEGLLGMNILRAFDFSIDQTTPALLLNEL
jgi:clan AA aspartic protease (TIGR02281 family)